MEWMNWALNDSQDLDMQIRKAFKQEGKYQEWQKGNNVHG